MQCSEDRLMCFHIFAEQAFCQLAEFLFFYLLFCIGQSVLILSSLLLSFSCFKKVFLFTIVLPVMNELDIVEGLGVFRYVQCFPHVLPIDHVECCCIPVVFFLETLRQVLSIDAHEYSLLYVRCWNVVTLHDN